jgi:hypothetical protein
LKPGGPKPPRFVKLEPIPEGFSAEPKEGPKLPEGYEDIYEGYADRETSSPGGRAEKEKTAIGNFVHENWPELPGMMGLEPGEVFERGAEELFAGREPKLSGIREFPLPHPEYPPGFKPRPDVFFPETGRVVEVGPYSQRSIRLKLAEAQQYAEWVNRYFSRPGGVANTGAEALYRQKLVGDWLKKIGVLPDPGVPFKIGVGAEAPEAVEAVDKAAREFAELESKNPAEFAKLKKRLNLP